MNARSPRLIACMTATRADYPRVKAVLQEIERRPSLSLQLIVTGAHLREEYGMTVREIEEDGFPIAARVAMYDGDDTPAGMARAAARCAGGMVEALDAIRPDIFLITVDRAETLAAAMSGALTNQVIAHIQGGEVTGTIDESIRHAVTKLSHIHFPATADAGERLVRMGEDEGRVHVTGCPYLDIISRTELLSKGDLARKYGFDPARRLALLVQHPVTTEYGRAASQIAATLEALERFGELQIVAIGSNADAGGKEIREAMERQSRFTMLANMHERDFLSLMAIADIMLGNSSAAIREAPSFHLPAVNVGSRQHGRQRAANVIDAPHDADAIAAAIDKGLNDERFREGVVKAVNPYGDGGAARRIVDILESLEITPALLQKRITY